MTVLTDSPASLAPARTVRASLRRLYLTRGVVAVAWAAVFAVVASGLSAATVTLLVVYPAVDIAASLWDARTGRGGRSVRVQLVNAAISTVALVGLAIASTHSTSTVLAVFGTWAAVSGLLQLVVAFRRRARVGRQWAVLVSGGLSTIAGISFAVMAAGDAPKLTDLGGYAGLGGVLFLVAAIGVGRGGAAGPDATGTTGAGTPTGPGDSSTASPDTSAI